jgi:hypothetical protein
VKARVLLSVAALCATAGSASFADAAPRRVVVAGPPEDTIAARVQKELTALGFEAIRVGDLESCARGSVVAAAQDAFAMAATCSDGDQVGVWVVEGGTLRLRDVVVVREEGDSGRETTAVRAAEVTRASLAMHETEDEPPPRAPVPPPVAAASVAPTSSPTVDKPAPKPSVGRAPKFLLGAGVSSLLGVDASVAAFSGQVEVGVLRHLTAAARIEYPIESSNAETTTTPIRVAPGFAGAGIGIPILSADSLVIPRLGAGVGAAWVKATAGTRERFDSTDSSFVSTFGSDITASFAMYASAGVSIRMYKLLRLTADGIIGSTTSRIVVRDQLTPVAYWGTPFGTLALRAELLFR